MHLPSKQRSVKKKIENFRRNCCDLAYINSVNMNVLFTLFISVLMSSPQTPGTQDR